MTVYVDNMRARLRPPRRRNVVYIMCHMIADSDEELHAMAARIGVARGYFQAGHGGHYDITLRRRAAAIAAGAVEITWRQCAIMCARREATGSLGSPSDSLRWFGDAYARNAHKLGQK